MRATLLLHDVQEDPGPQASHGPITKAEHTRQKTSTTDGIGALLLLVNVLTLPACGPTHCFLPYCLLGSDWTLSYLQGLTFQRSEREARKSVTCIHEETRLEVSPTSSHLAQSHSPKTSSFSQPFSVRVSTSILHLLRARLLPRSVPSMLSALTFSSGRVGTPWVMVSLYIHYLVAI